MSGLNDLLEGVGNLVSVVPDAYDDLIKNTAKQTGNILSFPLELVNALLVRPRTWIANANYKLQETNAIIANKLSKIESEKIIAPPDYIAVHALQGLAYSMNSDELKDMYANLLAKAMFKDTLPSVHPAFSQIIGQLSPIDCKVFKMFSPPESAIAIKDLYIKNIKNGKIAKFIVSATSIDFADVKTATACLDNLIRLGLIKCGDRCYDSKLYEAIDNNPIIKEFYNYINSNIDNPTYEKLKFEEKTLSVTSFGFKFYEICCTDIN